MIAMVIQLLVQLAVAVITLAVRVALALAYVLGTLLGWLLGALWRAWRDRHAGQVPLRSPEFIGGDSPRQPPPPRRTEVFTPRPLRPRPRR